MDANQPLPPAAQYEVFLSFRGPDVRIDFADFLHTYFKRYKIRTFLDEEELRKGEKLAPSLIDAVKESKIYIPILSPDYASSKWCLQELALMVKCWKQGNGHIMLPIFYKTKPRNVRHQDGPYEEAFQEHARKFDAETIDEWKEALKAVGEMKGWSVKDSDRQGVVIDEVYSKVWSHLRADYMLVTDYLIGIDSHLEKLKELVQPDCEDVKVIGICGMGGIGKTTMAKALYNEVCGKFDGCCFVEDVREALSKTDGLVSLQSKIISTILRSHCMVGDASEGINIIRNRICKQKVLIILDDADARFEFSTLLGKLENFCSGSKFVITTRDRRVIEFFPSYELYELEGMSEDFSLQLFSRHAFEMDHPPEEHIALSMEFVKAAAGLPLSLKVIGSLLFRRDQSFWNATLKQLKSVLPSKVQESLRISYEALSYMEQQIFLDIACCFVGRDKIEPFQMWNSCGYHPEVSITTLIQGSLLKINKRDDYWTSKTSMNVFWMHDHLIDLGKTIVHEEDREHPSSRIWSTEDAIDVFAHHKGSERVEALKVNMRVEAFKIRDRQLEKLSGLRYLQVFYGNFEGNFETSLPNLCWLHLSHCYSLPDNLNMKKLAVLHIRHCKKVRDNWSGWAKLKKGAHNLKSITIVSCNRLKTVPDLHRCGNLEVIHLEGCRNMSGELHIGTMKNLNVLIFEGTGITKLNGDIAILQNLKEMRTSELTEIPNGMDRLSKLKILSIQCSKRVSAALPISLKDLRATSFIHILNLSDLTNLEELELSFYEHQLPGDKDHQLPGDKEHQLPGNMWKLSRLKKLNLLCFKCESLVAVMEEEVGNGMNAPPTCCSSCLPTSLQELIIWFSPELKRLPNLANLSNLTILGFNEIGVGEIIGLAGLRMLETLQIINAPNLINLDGLQYLTLLKEIDLQNCSLLERLPNLWIFNKLKKLQITRCPSLSLSGISFEVGEPSSNSRITDGLHVPDVEENGGKPLLSQEEPFLHLSALHSLESLKITKWERLTQVIRLETLESLKSLSIEYCTSLRELSNPYDLKNLETVLIKGCEGLTDVVAGLEKLESLKRLTLACRASMKKLSLFHWKHLQELNISRCSQLTEISGLEGLESLTKLCLCDCKSIETFPSLSGLKLLDHLDVSGCTQMAYVMGLEKLESLRYLNMKNCSSIVKLPDLSCLGELDISGCTQLTEVTGLKNLKGLYSLTIDESLEIPAFLESRLQVTRIAENGAPKRGYGRRSWKTRVGRKLGVGICLSSCGRGD